MSVPSIIPRMPTAEDEDWQTVLPLSVLEGLSDECIERQLEDTKGRVEITRRGIVRELPTGHCSARAFLASRLYRASVFQSCYCSPGGSIRFISGELFSPNVSIFPRDRKLGAAAEHLYAPCPAPIMAVEVVRDTDTNTVGKGLLKVRNDLFPAIGRDNTRIEEAWVLVIPRDTSGYDRRLTPSVLHWIPCVGPVISYLLQCVVHLLFDHGWYARPTDFCGWYGWWADLLARAGRWLVCCIFRTAQEQSYAPENVPYLAVCFREDPQTRYYPLHPDEYLLLPSQCFLRNLEPIAANELFRPGPPWGYLL